MRRAGSRTLTMGGWSTMGVFVVSGVVDEFVESYVAALADRSADLDRVTRRPSGLDAAGMLEALAHPWFTEPGRQSIGLQMMTDFMAPEGSLYFDAIYGDFRGQAAIRNWLVPTMATIDFIEFVPTAPAVMFDDGLGGTSLDEWQMFANIGDDRLPLSRGVSVRRYRDGWITWACDVYDTGPFRQPNPDPNAEPAPIPDWPRTTWEPDRTVADRRVAEMDYAEIANEFHPTDSEYHDPIFGVIRGRDAIRAWLTDIMAKVGNIAFEPLGPTLDNGEVSVNEWQQVAIQPDGTRAFMTRGTSVRRRRGGQMVYAADYFDTAPFLDPEVQAVSHACGSTVSLADVQRYRSVE
jgi:SnoaL-like domain